MGLMMCDCGKLISDVFPLHECRNADRAERLAKANREDAAFLKTKKAKASAVRRAEMWEREAAAIRRKA